MSKCDDQIADAARKRAKRIIAERLRGASVTEEVRCDDGAVLREQRDDRLPRFGATGHAVDQHDNRAGAGGSISDRAAMKTDVPQFHAGSSRSTQGYGGVGYGAVGEGSRRPALLRRFACLLR